MSAVTCWHGPVFLLATLVAASCANVEDDPHFARHMLFREEQSELRMKSWHTAVRGRDAARRLEARSEWRSVVGRDDDVWVQGERAEQSSGTNAEDKEVLLELYASTAGHDWTNNKGWANKSTDPCSLPWAGVYCRSNRVASIELVYNNMAGPLPQSLGKLTALQQLVFYSNMLTGEIPSSLFALPVLTELDLNNNLFTGSLPSHVTAKSLQSLVLYTNKLTGALPSVWDTPHMQSLQLSSNSFSGDAPEAIGEMSGLKELVISRTNVSGPYPTSWGNLHNLTQLWTFNTGLKGPLPSTWAGMRSLQNVEMDSVTGEMPSWIGNWNKVTVLIFARGSISGVLPESVCQLSHVQTLWLFQNSMSGPLPDCIGDLKSVLQFELSDNHFSGAIPDSVGKLEQLQFLYLSRNSISGHLPSTLGSLKNLQIMDLSSNALVGTVPETFNSLAGVMVDWALCYNKLSGPLTASLQPLFKAIDQFTCALYDNPWQCPIESVVPKSCDCRCDSCNTMAARQSCKTCLADMDCGFCQDGGSCLYGSSTGPGDNSCTKWHFGAASNCSSMTQD